MLWFGTFYRTPYRGKAVRDRQRSDSFRLLSVDLARRSIPLQSAVRSFMTGGKAFFDTNVLLYMFSEANVRKRAQAEELFQRYVRSGGICALCWSCR